MLTPPQRAAHLVMFKISIHLYRSRSARLNSRKPNSRLNSRRPNDIFNNQNPPDVSSEHDVIHTPAHFLSGGLLWQMVIFISFARERKTVPNYSKPYQTEW